MKDSYERRVRRGARLLDQERPDWFRKIDVDTLRLESTGSCILGQAFKDAVQVYKDGWDSSGFDRGRTELGIRDQEARYGFDADYEAYKGRNNAYQYGRLSEEWRRAIAQRYFVEAVRLSA